MIFKMKPTHRKDVAYAYKNARITLREAAELLGTDYYSTQDVLAEEGVPVSDLTEGEIAERKRRAEKDRY